MALPLIVKLSPNVRLFPRASCPGQAARAIDSLKTIASAQTAYRGRPGEPEADVKLKEASDAIARLVRS